jgi:short-subunit dehydrogenase
MAIAWVTGAGAGIGRAVSLELVKRGWTVAASSRTESNLDSLADEADKLGGLVLPFALDITKPEQAHKTVEDVEKNIGPIALSILNAGTYRRCDVLDLTAKVFHDHMDLNFMGTINCLLPTLQHMRARNKGHIAVVSSLTAYRGIPFASAYGASKAALTNMCESLKPELGHIGIDLTIIHPGFVKTPLTDKNEFFMPFLVEVEDAARFIADGLERRQFEISFPRRFAFLLKLARFLPYSLYFSITRRLIKD